MNKPAFIPLHSFFSSPIQPFPDRTNRLICCTFRQRGRIPVKLLASVPQSAQGARYDVIFWITAPRDSYSWMYLSGLPYCARQGRMYGAPEGEGWWMVYGAELGQGYVSPVYALCTPCQIEGAQPWYLWWNIVRRLNEWVELLTQRCSDVGLRVVRTCLWLHDIIVCCNLSRVCVERLCSQIVAIKQHWRGTCLHFQS